MKTAKQSVIIVLLFALLFAVVFVPMLYIEYQNNNMLNEFYIALSPTEIPLLDRQSQKTEDYNIWERIGIINKSVVVQTATSTESETELLRSMEEQLAAISRYRALPDISLTGVVQASILKETYIDWPSDLSFSSGYAELLDSDRVLNVWELVVEYQDYVVRAYMDTVTNAIYEVIIVTKDSGFLYPSGLSDTGFLEYLKSFSEIPPHLGMVFSAESYYSNGKICLYLHSVSQDNQQEIYQFSHTTADDKYPMYVITRDDEKSRIAISDAAER